MASPQQTIFNADQVEEMVGKLCRAIADSHQGGQPPSLVGIRTGGANLGYRLQSALAALYPQPPDLGLMDITLYRDDWTRQHHRPKVGKTEIDFPIDDRVIILVDDVIFSGRTVRAALDALIDFGRPRRIGLAVLVDRGHRELPIQPDYTGTVVQTTRGQAVDVVLDREYSSQDAILLRNNQ